MTVLNMIIVMGNNIFHIKLNSEVFEHVSFTKPNSMQLSLVTINVSFI